MSKKWLANGPFFAFRYIYVSVLFLKLFPSEVSSNFVLCQEGSFFKKVTEKSVIFLGDSNIISGWNTVFMLSLIVLFLSFHQL
jgi:hypothetical protein